MPPVSETLAWQTRARVRVDEAGMTGPSWDSGWRPAAARAPRAVGGVASAGVPALFPPGLCVLGPRISLSSGVALTFLISWTGVWGTWLLSPLQKSARASGFLFIETGRVEEESLLHSIGPLWYHGPDCEP